MASLRVAPAPSSAATAAASSAGPISTGAATAPATTSVISPRTPSAAHSTSEARGPRRISSWVLVSSRHTAAGRSSPKAAAASCSASTSRCGDSKKTIVRRSSARPTSRDRRAPAAQPPQRGPPLAAPPRQEPLEAEAVAGQPGDRQRRRHRGGAGHRGHEHAGVDRRPHQRVAGIGHRRHAGVGQQQDRLPVGERGQQARQPRALHRLVEGHDPPGERDLQIRGQAVQPPGVLDGQDVGRGHRRAQPRSDVARLPQRGAPENQPSRHDGQPVTVGASGLPAGARREPASAGGQAGPLSTLARMAVPVETAAPAAVPDPPAPAPRARRRPPPRPLRDRTPPLPADNRRAWLLALGLGVVSLVSRLVFLSYPSDKLFDEAYYPPEADELLRWGFEYNRGYPFSAPPPLGKWLIALGEAVFGYDSLGWRVPSAIAGTIAVVVLVRLARRLTGSTLLGLVAGLLLAVDGFSFVIARTGLLDVFVQFFIVSAVACLVVDRDRVGRRIRERGEAVAFRLGPRGWRIAAGFLFGCSCAVKWSGIYFLAFFAVLSLFWDRTAWRDAGVPRPTRTTLRRGLPGALWALAVAPVLTYLASFTGWFLGENSQGRHWADQHPDTAFPFIPGALRSLWHMH